jgi:hypothetical protein
MEVHDQIELAVAIQIADPDNVIVRFIDKAVGRIEHLPTTALPEHDLRICLIRPGRFNVHSVLSSTQRDAQRPVGLQ